MQNHAERNSHEHTEKLQSLQQMPQAHCSGKIYIAIDLKSFYASVECRDRGLDPLNTYLVVADESRTDKTICLAVSPALKSCGVPGRGRLFEVKQKIKAINAIRRRSAPEHTLEGSSCFVSDLQNDPKLALDFIIAPPRMARYMKYSTRIYEIYLKYIAPEDIIVYSIDEVFIDVSAYLTAYRLSPRDLAMKIILDVLDSTGITATVGIGSNLYLAKAAMDIVAKNTPAGPNGVHIAELDEMNYRRNLWSHSPLTDFWRIGKGCARRLEKNGMFTMGDVARCSHENEDMLYKLFGKNAELLIDHAWGWEPCTVEAVKAYRPASSSLGSGQVLPVPYEADKAGLVLREMTDSLVLGLLDKGLVTDQIVITVSYDSINMTDPAHKKQYRDPVAKNYYGKTVPKHARGTANLDSYTSSEKKIMSAATELFERIVDPDLLIRRLNITANHVLDKRSVPERNSSFEQLDLFTDYKMRDEEQLRESAKLEYEEKIQRAVLTIKKKFGKNAILKGMSLEKGATAKDRNSQIGGHKA